MNAYDWYSQLVKPAWAPPSWLFGPVWSVLYVLIAVSFAVVFWLAWRRKIPPSSALPFVLNLAFNFSFTYFQFTLRNNFLAALDVLLVLGTLVWAMAAIFPHHKWISYFQIPYLLWVAFATILQLTITFLNP
jgi:tryptophan-rich sensory protein